MQPGEPLSMEASIFCYGDPTYTQESQWHATDVPDVPKICAILGYDWIFYKNEHYVYIVHYICDWY